MANKAKERMWVDREFKRFVEFKKSLYGSKSIIDFTREVVSNPKIFVDDKEIFKNNKKSRRVKNYRNIF